MGHMNIRSVPGTKVRYAKEPKGEYVWGNCDDPRMYLILGDVYTVKMTEKYSWHTQVWLEECSCDYSFNSVHFDAVEDSE